MVIHQGSSRRGLAALAVAGVLVAGLAGPSDGSTPAATGQPSGVVDPAAITEPRQRPTTVTLVTGDRVTAAPAPDGRWTYTVDAAPRAGGAPATFSTFGE